MIKSIEKSAKTEEMAIAAALEELGLTRDDVNVEILERAKSGFLGIGASPAVVKVSYEAPDEVAEPVAQPEPEVPAAPAEAPAAVSAAPADMDETHAKVYNFLSGLLEHMGVKAEIEITDKEDGGMNVNLSGKGMGMVIGRRGETLDAIQQLTSYSVNRTGSRVRVQLDAQNYRAKREQRLERLANKVAAKVVKYRRSVTLEPMNAYERHVIHTALQDVPGVTTYSTGVAPTRRVIVAFDRESK